MLLMTINSDQIFGCVIGGLLAVAIVLIYELIKNNGR